jgi:purine-binding chemotaxis protein CheW
MCKTLQGNYSKLNFEIQTHNNPNTSTSNNKTMRHSKYLIFKVNEQKFAIKVSKVINIIEKPRFAITTSQKPYYNEMIDFKGAIIPIIDLREVLSMNKDDIKIANCVLIAEIKINNLNALSGIAIDEIIEISSFDDFFAYPYNAVIDPQTCNLRESVHVLNGEPVIVINTDKLLSKQIETEAIKAPIMQFAAN